VAEHSAAQRLGRERWYEAYELRVCRVERAYGFRR
jgi:heme-degrading monooxygenase HmoA